MADTTNSQNPEIKFYAKGTYTAEPPMHGMAKAKGEQPNAQSQDADKDSLSPKLTKQSEEFDKGPFAKTPRTAVNTVVKAHLDHPTMVEATAPGKDADGNRQYIVLATEKGLGELMKRGHLDEKMKDNIVNQLGNAPSFPIGIDEPLYIVTYDRDKEGNLTPTRAFGGAMSLDGMHNYATVENTLNLQHEKPMAEQAGAIFEVYPEGGVSEEKAQEFMQQMQKENLSQNKMRGANPKYDRLIAQGPNGEAQYLSSANSTPSNVPSQGTGRNA